jgi:hypothetical protein
VAEAEKMFDGMEAARIALLKLPSGLPVRRE